MRSELIICKVCNSPPTRLSTEKERLNWTSTVSSIHPATAGNINKKTSILDADEEFTMQNHSKLAFNNCIKY